MEEKNKHIFKDSLKQLPIYKVDDRVWQKIEEELDNSVVEKNRIELKEALNKFSSKKATDFLWENIEQKIEEAENKKHKVNHFFKIAAAVALLVAISFFLKNYFENTTEKETITFSKETIEEDNQTSLNPLEFEGELDQLIQEQCSAQPTVCKNPEFEQLTTQLEELTKSYNELKIMYEQSNNDPETYQYVLRIQKEKVEVSKKLLNYLIS